MKPKTKLSTLKKIIVPILRRNNVVRAGIFGSYARGEEKKRSDVDILIRFRGKKNLLDVIRLEREIKTSLGRKVDLLTYNSLHPLLKGRILEEEVRIL